ncbi:DUF421 domain-containing protein [Tellurirhabdus rosea]|uniref:DUF421 domain-containing protein n=1 Tax=Tellurirhabdus rosea TaxID=2674997 RepID=UPI0022527AA7|nr:YetF domain-containing protein [Tellurirhabdus rosea]
MNKIVNVDWETLLVPSTSVFEMVVRGTLTYWFCLLYLRVFRRGASQAGITDLLLVTLIADAAQNSMAHSYESVTEGLVLVGTLVFWNFLLDYLGMKTLVIRKLNSPDPVLLIKDGRMLQHNMRKEFLHEEELRGMLREQGVDDPASVKECYIESSGNISVLKKE